MEIGKTKAVHGLYSWGSGIILVKDVLTRPPLVSLLALQYNATAMELARAIESLKAAELCLQEGLVNSAASRAYYAMFQAAQIALEAQGLVRSEWSHKGLHSSFNQELIHRRKLYPRILRDYLTSALAVRQAADYGETGVSAKIAQRQVRRAATFVQTVEEVISRGKPYQR
jgi:uncharacterized protein (UPF0332 family)